MIEMLFEYGWVKIKVPNDLIPLLTDLALVKGMNIADKLVDAEAVLKNQSMYIVEIDTREFVELAELLVGVIS